MTAAPHTRCQPDTTAAIDYGPAPNDCDITPGKVFGTYGVIVAVLGLLKFYGVI